MAYFTDIDKLKINNVLITFLVILTCGIAPASIAILVDNKLIFSVNALPALAAITIIATAQFGFCYICFAIVNAIQEVGVWDDDKVVSRTLRIPLLMAVGIMFLFYYIIYLMNLFNPMSLAELKVVALCFNIGMIFRNIIQMIIFWIRGR